VTVSDGELSSRARTTVTVNASGMQPSNGCSASGQASPAALAPLLLFGLILSRRRNR
jgi:uncharacterized protein (TIGR03382 family)